MAKTAAIRQAAMVSPAYYQVANASLKQGLNQSAMSVGKSLQVATPHTAANVVGMGGKAALSGGSHYAHAAKNYGMGFMEGVSKQHGINSGLTGTQRANLAIQQAQTKATQLASKNKNVIAMQNATKNTIPNVSKNKAILNATNRGIDSSGLKNVTTGKSTNKAIVNHSQKMSGQPKTTSKSASAGASKSVSNSKGSGGQSKR